MTQQPPPQAGQRPQIDGVRSAATGHIYPRSVRPDTFASSAPAYAATPSPHAPPPQASGNLEQVWDAGEPRSNRWLFKIFGYGAGALAMVILIAIILFETGISATVAGFLLALLPLAIVLAGVAWLDRWEPEPKALLL